MPLSSRQLRPVASNVFIAGESIAIYDFVQIRDAGAGAFKIFKADKDLSDINSIGIALESATLNNPVDVQHIGLVSNSAWSWTIDKPLIYADGGANKGLGTQTKPTSGLIHEVGLAISATDIILSSIGPEASKLEDLKNGFFSFFIPTTPSRVTRVLGEQINSFPPARRLILTGLAVTFRQNNAAALNLLIVVKKFDGGTASEKTIFSINPIIAGINFQYRVVDTAVVVDVGEELIYPARSGGVWVGVSDASGINGPSQVEDFTAILGFKFDV